MRDDAPLLTPHHNERTRLHADERRIMLVEAAYQMIAEKGLLALRVRDVAERVGINHTTLLYHFPTKESLITAVVDYVGNLFLTTQEPTAPSEPDSSPRGQLHAYFRNLAYQIRFTPQQFLVIDELFLQAQRDPVLRQLVQAEAQWESYLMSIFEAGIQQGIFAASAPLKILAHSIMVFCKGLPLQMTAQSDDIEQVIEQFEQWIIASLMP